MATLAANVNASDGLWTISADHPDTVDFLQVDDEIVAVIADFPSSTYAPTGATTPPKIRVERGAGGTTAASHSSGATLTPLIPPSAGGGAGTPLSMDNTVDAPVDITSLVAAGATFVGDEATLRGKDFYAQDTDPGAVGFESVWKDTSAVPPLWWRRNATNDGWDAVVEITVIGVADEDVILSLSATASGAGNADAELTVITTGSGEADASVLADAQGTGNADASRTAQISGFGSPGNANAQTSATASDGTADVRGTATSDGTAQAGSLAVRGAESAGMDAIVDGTSARMAFNGTTPIAIPVIPATPDAQDIADVLVALGLVTQAP